MRAPPFSVCRKRCSIATAPRILPLPHVLQRRPRSCRGSPPLPRRRSRRSRDRSRGGHGCEVAAAAAAGGCPRRARARASGAMLGTSVARSADAACGSSRRRARPSGRSADQRAAARRARRPSPRSHRRPCAAPSTPASLRCPCPTSKYRRRCSAIGAASAHRRLESRHAARCRAACGTRGTAARSTRCGAQPACAAFARNWRIDLEVAAHLLHEDVGEHRVHARRRRLPPAPRAPARAATDP